MEKSLGMGKSKVRHIPRFSVVRLDDGRLGVLDNQDLRKPLVCVSRHTGVQVKADAELEVIRYPALLAYDFIESHE